MATSQNPLTPEEQNLRAQVQLLDEQALKWSNILNLKVKINKASEDQKAFEKAIGDLQGEQARNATRYQGKLNTVKKLEENLIEAKKRGNQNVAKQAKLMLDQQQAKLKDLAKTEGGALMKMALAAKQRKDALTAERNLIKDINKERGLGGKIMDLFRSKEERQRQIDIARARAGGGVNPPPGGPTTTAGAAGSGSSRNSGKDLGLVGTLVAGATAIANTIKNIIGTLGRVILTSLAEPLKQVSNLVSGGINGGYGIGGGAISGEGATSILGGFQTVASTIPFIGGLLSGLIGVLKGVVDLVLGLDQGITNFARNLGISKTQAKGIKEEFRGIVSASDSIVINETRLMESQAELTKALGIRSRFSASILKNNIELKEVAGIELETRKAIAQISIQQNKSAVQLTKSILAQGKAFEFQTGIAFEYRQVLAESVKQSGYLGLTFTQNTVQLTKSLMTAKAMGYELKQLDTLANSFLDFESSISKEMEAQVLTGRQMNLTLAREAALNNDLVGLAKEINKNVGSTADYLNLNRIQQDAIAESVGMTRDGLAEVLRQQEYYQKLGATNLKQAQEQLRVLKQQGLTQAEISKKIGEDAYNYITQTSTAERLAEVMNRIKIVFVEFMEKSGLLDFITNPQKIQAFAQGLVDRLAGAVNLIGDIIAGLLDAIGALPGTDKNKWQSLADRVRIGSSNAASSVKSISSTLGGVTAPSIGTTIQDGARPTSTPTAAPTVESKPVSTLPPPPVNLYLDSYKIGNIMFNQTGAQIYTNKF